VQTYQYTGINRYGERVKGQLEGRNQADVEQKLQAAKIDVLSIKQRRTQVEFFRRRKITPKEVIALTFQLEQLLRAGVPLLEIIADLRDSFDNHAIKEMLMYVYESMEGGQTFSGSLQPYRDVFGEVYLSLVAVGEKTGSLEATLHDLGEMLKWEDELSAKAKKVMIYPSIVAVVVIGVVAMMMIFVVPELLAFITEMGGEIGFATKSLIAVSNFVQNNIVFLIIAPFVLVALYKTLYKKIPAFRLAVDRLIFKIKVIGPVLYKLKIARFSNTLAVMYASGMTFTESMRLAASVTGNRYLENNVFKSIRLIQEGEPIYKSFERAEVFPPLGIRMVKVGELSGKMDEALKNTSYFYDREAKESIEKIEPAIEPLLTIIMALIVGWVMIAVLGPVYDTMTKIDI
jgi:type IV pilus assembly protein PilC